MVGYTYTMDAARSVTAGAIDGGEKPSVPSAMLKYHVTEMGRQVANDAMDVHGGKGIQLGPRNYLGRGYQVVPVAITVEGANILTRSLIIFGQGAIRCHPFVLKEMNAARNPDRKQGVDDFDSALFGHIGFTISNAGALLRHGAHARALHARAGSRRRPSATTSTSCASRASFAFAVDVAMLTLGGYLKKKENLSARLGDVLSAHVPRVDGAQAPREPGPPGRRPAASSNGPAATSSTRRRSSCTTSCATSPTASSAGVMRALIFPGGRAYSAPERPARPQARRTRCSTPTEVRDRLCRFVYRTLEPGNPLGLLQEALVLSQTAEPIEKRIRVEGVKTGRVTRARRAGPDRPGAERRHHLRNRGRDAARLRPQGHGAHQRRRLRIPRARGASAEARGARERDDVGSVARRPGRVNRSRWTHLPFR